MIVSSTMVYEVIYCKHGNGRVSCYDWDISTYSVVLHLVVQVTPAVVVAAQTVGTHLKNRVYQLPRPKGQREEMCGRGWLIDRGVLQQINIIVMPYWEIIFICWTVNFMFFMGCTIHIFKIPMKFLFTLVILCIIYNPWNQVSMNIPIVVKPRS